jgi:endonuclease G, mitochondrial
MKNIFKTCLVICNLLITVTLYSQNKPAQLHEPCEGDGQILRYNEFALQYAEEFEQAFGVAYVLESEELDFPNPVTRSSSLFKADINVETGSAVLDDYRNSGYDRGHLSRAEYNKRTEESYRESFLLSNMSPQVGRHFNQTGGLWYRAEEYEMELARKYGKIYGVSGPIFINDLGTIGHSGVTVPGFFYKVITFQDEENNWNSIGLLFPHRADRQLKILDCIIPVHLLEAITGLDFNCFLPIETQMQIEKFVCIE